MNSSTQLFKITFYTLLIQVIIWILSINNTVATDVVIKKFPCENTTTTKCICKSDCLIPYKEDNNTYCREKKCWKFYDESCYPNGMNFVAPTVLNAIPFTSVLGVGYAALQRWDLFGMQLCITFGPLLLFCCIIGNILICCDKPNDSYDIENNNDNNKCDCDEATPVFVKVYNCCYTTILITFWVLSIVWVSSPRQIKDGNGCYLSGF